MTQIASKVCRRSPIPPVAPSLDDEEDALGLAVPHTKPQPLPMSLHHLRLVADTSQPARNPILTMPSL